MATGAKAVGTNVAEKAKSPSVTRRTLHYYWGVTKTQPAMFALAIIATLFFVFFLTFASPYIVGLIVDKVAAEGAGGGLAAGASFAEVLREYGPYILAFVLSEILGQIGSKTQDYAVWKLEIKASYDLATHVFDTLSRQSMTFHSNRFGGSLVSQTANFLSGYESLIEQTVYALIPVFSTVAFTIGILATKVPVYVLILTVLVIVYVIIAYRLYKRILPLNAAAAGARNELSGELSDSITNILSVKTFGREKYERGIFDEANRKVFSTGSRRMRASIFRGAITSSITIIIMAVLVVFITGAHSWFGISAGTLVMMFTYTYSLTMQLNRISLMFQNINRGFGNAHDMTVVLDEPTLVQDEPDAPDLVIERGDIRFQDICFSYTDETERDAERGDDVDSADSGSSLEVFSHFDLEIPAGQRIGLVGRSGSGKTTLTKLLLRLVDIQGGSILVDGQDIAKVAQVSLRQQIAYVPQEPLLFHRTIRENIAYGKPDASFEEIRYAAEKANALEFIEKLPNGFETITGERGVKLSGGQRQRIAIARTILNDAPILVLDEATSALDSESEKLIQDALGNLMQGRTSIVVAHRLSTVASLDRIVVLSEGCIVEDGTHAQLKDAGGEYSRLWSRQSGAFLGND